MLTGVIKIYTKKTFKQLLSHNNIEISDIDVVALDVFDTILIRKTPPMETHKEWSEIVKNAYDINISANNITNLKFNIARLYKLINIFKGNDKEYDYKNVIYVLHKLLRIKDSYEDFMTNCINFEFEIEKKSTFVPGYFINWIDEILDMQKELIIISDYYMTSDFILKLLETKTNISLNNKVRVFTSADCKLQKATGRIYKKVIKKLKIDPGSMVMIGDTFVSDYEMPKINGINSILLPRD